MEDVFMDKITICSIYDRLCFALTDYENHPDDEDTPDEYHDGEALYRKVCEVVNFMAQQGL